MVRTYNNNFSYSLLGIHCDRQLEQCNCAIYIIRVQGQVGHCVPWILADAIGRSSYRMRLLDSVVYGVHQGSSVGISVYLPSSFIGGPCDMRDKYLTSMA
ncbi:hypothetical protein LIER_31198 [Lithospermum erythrorhizon]|uniref:Uncharacterized protein n=1 Tax=Lithospermum erythrorhizon TaxID=34254 RepID=A0AAV3RVJ3_LITER